MHEAIQSMTGREFARNPSGAKRAALAAGRVVITDRGEPAFVLMAIGEYRRLSGGAQNMAERLALPEASGLAFTIEPVRIDAQAMRGQQPAREPRR